MGGYKKKCVGEREVAVVELADLGDDGVGTRSIMPAMVTDLKEEQSSSGTEEKRSREAGYGELELANSSFVELRRSTRRRVMIEELPESVSPANRASEPTTCSSSKASVELVGDRSTIADLTVQRESAQLETFTFSAGIEWFDLSRASPLQDSCPSESGNLESMAPARPSSEASSHHKSSLSEMPLELEIEEFFSAAEKDLQKRFSERYNFDIEKGVPLEGRYEWVREKP